MNYPLTEMSESQLLLLAEMIASRLRFEERSSKFNQELPVADHIDVAVIERLDTKFSQTIKDLKELNVWVLTALQIVKDRETIQSN